MSIVLYIGPYNGTRESQLLLGIKVRCNRVSSRVSYTSYLRQPIAFTRNLSTLDETTSRARSEGKRFFNSLFRDGL